MAVDHGTGGRVHPGDRVALYQHWGDPRRGLREYDVRSGATAPQAAYTTWPAYRVSQGEVRTMQHRLTDCFRQQRFPEPMYASEALTAITMFLAKNANGGVYAGPAMKR